MNTKSTGCKQPIKAAHRQPAMLTVLSAGAVAAVGVSRVDLLADGHHCIVCGAIRDVGSVDVGAPIWAHSRHDRLHSGRQMVRQLDMLHDLTMMQHLGTAALCRD